MSAIQWGGLIAKKFQYRKALEFRKTIADLADRVKETMGINI